MKIFLYHIVTDIQKQLPFQEQKHWLIKSGYDILIVISIYA